MSNSITQKLQYKQSVVKFSFKFGATKASEEFDVNIRTIYRWRKRYDGSLESLKDKSHRPKHHPNEHTKEEIQMIINYKNNNKETGLVVLWVKLRMAGYMRTIQGLYHAMVRLGIYKKAPSKRKHIQPPEVPIAKYPGERVQIDVKYVPQECMSRELKDLGERYGGEAEEERSRGYLLSEPGAELARLQRAGAAGSGGQRRSPAGTAEIPVHLPIQPG